MSKSKVEFIHSLQAEDRPLHPSEVTQRICDDFSWVCLYRADPELDPDLYRGYMVRPSRSREHTPDDPAGYWCIIAGSQSIGWQNLVWTKEMLQALDSEKEWTSDIKKLGEVLNMGAVHGPNDPDTPPNVVADKNGFTLALGCAIPRQFRETLRIEIATHGHLNPLHRAQMENFIPEEYVDAVLAIEFEADFARALDEICQE